MTGRVVEAVVFDVNETLFSLERLGPAFADAGVDPGLVPLWFARLLRDGFALTAMGRYAPFADLAADALRSVAPASADDAVAVVLNGFRQLDPHPDVAPAFEILHTTGVPAVTLTNGGTDLVQHLLQRAGLSRYVQRCLSVDAIRRWKPAPEPYQYAATELGIDPYRLALVASHPWDCAGAHQAGLRAGWVNRRGESWPHVFPTPDATGADLPAVITGLLDRA
ncbi:haloacid dehalogenase type II [Micromonospora sp. CPCC 205371]|nr:haloacid dehalogenase type II [Micromonospora sp. CPCC 205371]